MFTGLIEDVGTLVGRRETGKAGKLLVRTALPTAEIALGDSLAVNGACLTVEAFGGAGELEFHTLSETLRRTNLGELPLGAAVNLERALRLGGRLGGHLVQGHVDATAAIRDIRLGEDDTVVTIELPVAIAHLAIPKGSIAVNGVSLTIATLAIDSFTVHIIPHTWRATSLATAKPGERVNLEADLLGKYVLRQQQVLAATSSPISLDTLREAGF